MTPDDATTPLDGLTSREQPTLHRAPEPLPEPAPRGAGGFAPGMVLAGRYRIVALLGRGGMGAVYRADDLRLAQPVALKFVSTGSDALSLENLYHEVRVARQVSHPNVCRVHDVVEADGLRFIAMEYVDGEDLASLLRRIGRLPAAKATDVARDIASGLAAAHERGIIHRDLKPANVMIDGNGRAHVTDFGLASLAGTHEGRIAGTPAYMAPEQVGGYGITTRSDVYAFGLVLHELFTGERVYASASYADRQKLPPITPRPVSSSVSDADPVIDGVIAACLAPDPAQRPASAREVLAMLPGSDALDAAMAAGETPSPEMVAAAAETGELPLRIAVPLLAFIVLGILAAAWQSQSYVFTKMTKPPAVMRERAEEIVALAGERLAAHDETYFFTYDAALRLAVRGPELDRMRPGVMHFVHRRSPARMAPREVVQAANDVYIFVPGRVTLTDPPLDTPGSAIVILDQHRALVEYRANPSPRAGTPDWGPLLEATGIDRATLVPIVPNATPPVASDARVAWSGTYPGRREPIVIHAASLGGAPVWLRVAGPWGVAVAPSRLRAGGVVGAVQFGLLLVCTIIAIVVTRRSMRRGRMDRRGALRIALYLGGAILLSAIVAAHYGEGVEDQARMLSSGFGAAAAAAVLIWCTYIALEPGIRRTSPRVLIGWTRLLAGRFRDAMVGREILLGIAAGVLGYQFFWLQAVLRRMPYVKSSTIPPLRVFVGDMLISHVEAIEIAMGAIFLWLLLRRLLGATGAAIAFVLLCGAYATVVPATGLFILLLIFVLVRVGLLSGVAMGAAFALLGNSPLTLDVDAWYWPRAVTILLILALSAAWAARVAAGRAMFRLSSAP
jgi:hypothetical protein